MHTITSRDGTTIAYERTGSGPPLILVHGAGGFHGRWAAVLPALSAEFTVCAIDRRGRGASGDSDRYEIEREYEDVASIVESIGEPVNLFGHSFGAICALEATLLTDRVETLILYEPPITAPSAPAEISSRLEAMLEAGDREGVLEVFLAEIARIPEAEIRQMKESPAWPARVAAAHTMLREGEAVSEYRFDAGRFAGMKVPTLLMVGGDSPALYRESVQMIDEALPESRITRLPGQQHVAMDTAPDLFARELLAFLRE